MAKAIGIAVPYLTLLHFDKLGKCFEASAVGSLVLRRYGFTAKLVPVDAIIAKRLGDDDSVTGIIGSPTDVLERLERCHQLAFREGVAPSSSLSDGVHVVIQCGPWIVDPTLGQINKVHPKLTRHLGVAALTELDAQSCALDSDTSVSWHHSAKANDYKADCAEVVRRYDPTGAGKNSGYYADCAGAVARLLSVNLSKEKWFDMFPSSTGPEILQRMRAAGFDI